MKLSHRLKEISDAIQSIQLRENMGCEDWVIDSKDCPNNDGQSCDEFRNKTGICSHLYCPITLNYKGY